MQTAETPSQGVTAGVAVSPTEVLEGFQGQFGCLLRRGVCLQEIQPNLAGGLTEDMKCQRVVASQHGLQAVGQAHTALGEMMDQTDLSPNPTGKQRVAGPGLETISVGAQNVGNDEGIAGIPNGRRSGGSAPGCAEPFSVARRRVCV